MWQVCASFALVSVLLNQPNIIKYPSQVLRHSDLWDYAGDKKRGQSMEFSWEEDLSQVHSCHLGDPAPKIRKSWVRFTGSTGPMLWCWNQADLDKIVLNLTPQWSNESNGISYFYCWFLVTTLAHSFNNPGEETKTFAVHAIGQILHDAIHQASRNVAHQVSESNW